MGSGHCQSGYEEDKISVLCIPQEIIDSTLSQQGGRKGKKKMKKGKKKTRKGKKKTKKRKRENEERKREISINNCSV